MRAVREATFCAAMFSQKRAGNAILPYHGVYGLGGVILIGLIGHWFDVFLSLVTLQGFHSMHLKESSVFNYMMVVLSCCRAGPSPPSKIFSKRAKYDRMFGFVWHPKVEPRTNLPSTIAVAFSLDFTAVLPLIDRSPLTPILAPGVLITQARKVATIY